MEVSLSHRLIQLENDCRKQVFNVTYLGDLNLQFRIREGNALSRCFVPFLTSDLRPAFIQAKNQEIGHWSKLITAKTRNLQVLYLSLKHEIEQLRQEISENRESRVTQTLQFELFMQFRPLFYHQSMLASTDPDLPFLPFHLAVGSEVSLRAVLMRCGRFYELLGEVKELKRTAKQLLVSNNEAVDVSEALETCRRLSTVALEPVYVLVEKWEICLQAAEILTSQLFLVKSILHQAVASRPAGDNSAPQALPLLEDLETYAETCFASATKCKELDQTKQSGYWVSLVRRIHKAIGRESYAVETFYGESLRCIRKYPQALKVFKAALRYLNAHEYDGETLAGVMVQIAYNQYDLNRIDREVKWYQRVLDLGLGRNPESVDLYGICISLSYELTHLYRFEESEVILNRVKTDYSPLQSRLCNAFGLLYLTREEFSLSEHWLRQGLMLSPKDPNSLHINLANLCFKQGRTKEAGLVLGRYMRLRGVCAENRACAMALQARDCIEANKYEEAGKWLQKAERLEGKWQVRGYQPARRLLYEGNLAFETGHYAQAEVHFLAALASYKELNSLEGQIPISYRLSLVYLLTEQIAKAESALAPYLNRPEAQHRLTAFARLFEAQGRIYTCKQALPEARICLDKALSIQDQSLPNTKETARTHSALGTWELASHRYSQAYEHFTQALLVLGNSGDGAEAYLGLAEMYRRGEDWESAKRCLEAGLKPFASLPAHPLAVKLHTQLQLL